jgi:multidrug efflux pump subunit AcrA (membrane-fusion protein)
VPLDFTQTGQITRIYVKPGDKVTVGEPLATQNQSLAQATLQDAQSVLTADKAVVAALQAAASQSGSTSASTSTSTQAAAAQLSEAQASLAAAQTTVDQDQADLSALTLTSPIDGTVAAVGGIVGDLDSTDGVHGFNGPGADQGGSGSGSSWTLFPGQSSQTGAGSSDVSQPLVWLVNTDYTAAIQVGEAEIPNLHVGSAAALTVDALDRTVHGTVSQITLIPSDQNGSVEYEVSVTTAGWPAGTADGMSLTATFP